MILYRGYKSGEAKAKNPERYFGAVAGYSKLRLLLQNCTPVARIIFECREFAEIKMSSAEVITLDGWNLSKDGSV